MKQLILITILAVTVSEAFCLCPQSDTLRRGDRTLSSVFMGVSIGKSNNGAGIAMGVTAVFSNNWGVSLRYGTNYIEAENKPDDYYDLVFIIPFLTNGLPTDQYRVLALSGLREIPTRSKMFRFGFEAGPSWVFSRIAQFTPVESIPFFGSNYNVHYDVSNNAGLSLRAKSEFLFSRFAGIELAANAHLSKSVKLYGIEVCITLGLVRKE